MRQFLLLLIFMSVKFAFSQQDKLFINDKSFNVTTISPLFFTYSSADELLEKKIVPGALELRIKAKNSYNIYVNVQSNSVAEQSYINNNLSLRLATNMSKAATVSKEELLLSTQPQLLFIQPGKVNGMEEVAFLYDVILNPIATFIKPGGYNFSITFTMTPQ